MTPPAGPAPDTGRACTTARSRPCRRYAASLIYEPSHRQNTQICAPSIVMGMTCHNVPNGGSARGY
jgi:hypothetical protein